MPFDIPDPEQHISKIMDKLDGELKERDKPALENTLRQVFIEGKSPKDALGLSPKELESMYAYAYNLFTHGKFKDALLMMEQLMKLDPENPRYPLGCGAALHQMKDYQMASAYYLIAFHLDQEDPVPLYYMYDCFKNLNDLGSALLMIQNVIAVSGDKPHHAVLKERAIRTKESILQEIEALGAKENPA